MREQEHGLIPVEEYHGDTMTYYRGTCLTVLCAWPGDLNGRTFYRGDDGRTYVEIPPEGQIGPIILLAPSDEYPYGAVRYPDGYVLVHPSPISEVYLSAADTDSNSQKNDLSQP